MRLTDDDDINDYNGDGDDEFLLLSLLLDLCFVSGIISSLCCNSGIMTSARASMMLLPLYFNSAARLFIARTRVINTRGECPSTK